MEKINIADLLRDCPSGMELNCMMYEDVYFDYVDELNIIHCYIQNEGFKTSITFNQHGTPHSDIKSKCVIFPQGKTTWEGFHRPFIDGDVVATSGGIFIGITSGGIYGEPIPTYCIIDEHNDLCLYFDKPKTWCFNRLATKEEKEKLFQAINDNGYKWNPETKTLVELPKFKVGYKIKCIKTGNIYEIIKIIPNYYIVKYLGSDIMMSWNDHDKYEIVSNKFDISKLKPFDKVLVRSDNKHVWSIQFFERLNNRLKDSFVCMGGWRFRQCIPFEGNEHLLNTINEPDNFYKTWKNEATR
jgi:hypothetical protein